MKALRTFALTCLRVLHAPVNWVKSNPIESQIGFVFVLIIIGWLRIPHGPPESADGRVLISGTNLDIDVLEDTFESYGFLLDDIRNGDKDVPRLIIDDVPNGLIEMRVIDRRKRLFFRAILPMILATNETIKKDRRRLQSIRTSMRIENLGEGALNSDDTAWLMALAERYGIDPLEDELTLIEAADVLHRRVAPIPPSLALAQAVEESAWGTSRFAREGNALFGQWVWNEDAGIVPEEQRQGPKYAVRAFDSPIQSVEAYAWNLNTHWAYADFRARRLAMLDAGQAPDGWELAKTLIRYSERREGYVDSLHTIMRVNDLRQLDQAKLASPDAMRKLADAS